MNKHLHHLKKIDFTTQSGHQVEINLSYELFGKDLHSAPIVLVNHALTGNSTVAGEDGWWKEAVGSGKPIDTDKYTILAFNIPGNGYDGELIDDAQVFVTKDIAKLFLLGLEELEIDQLYAIIGGSLGGSIGWEMLNINPKLAHKFVPVATDWKTSDWLYGQCMIQDFLLNANDKPLQKARIHAMLCYRTPESINERFGNHLHEDKKIRKSEDWLNFHGERLNERFSLSAYKMMNRLLSTVQTVAVDENPYQSLAKIEADIHIVSVDSDLFFAKSEDDKTYQNIKKHKTNIHQSVINSIHGHDAFLMEYEQLNNILHKIF